MVSVVPAKPSDVQAIAALTQQMDRFYGASDIAPLRVRLRQIREALFTDRPSVFALLAWEAETLVGFASYSFLWPAAGLTRSLFLKELYVAETARRTGVGTRLMRGLLRIAVDNECSRVEWHTETTNEAARRFYAKLGAPELTGKVLYRMQTNDLKHATSAAGDAVDWL